MLHQLTRDLTCELRLEPASHVNLGQFLTLEFGLVVKVFLLEFEVGLFRVGLRVHRNIFARRHRQCSGKEPGNAGDDDRRDYDDAAAATPITRLAVETMPSFAPSTAARSQPTRCERCISLCGICMITLYQ